MKLPVLFDEPGRVDEPHAAQEFSDFSLRLPLTIGR